MKIPDFKTLKKQLKKAKVEYEGQIEGKYYWQLKVCDRRAKKGSKGRCNTAKLQALEFKKPAMISK